MSERGRARLTAVIALLALGLRGTPAQASPPFELFGSTLGSGGMNARATGSDAASTYFNPARLAQAPQALELGMFVLNDGIDLTLLARNPAVDVPEAALNEFGMQTPTVPTTWLQNGCDPTQGGRCVGILPARPRQGAGSSGNTRGYQVIGLVSTIAERWLTVGVYGLVPLASFLQGHTFFVDEREQYFSNSLHPELYSDRLSAMSLTFGAGSQLLPWLALGVGISLNLTNSADAVTYVGNSDMLAESLQLSTKIDVSTGVAPHVGVSIQPIEGLDLSLTAHAPQEMKIVTGFGTFLPNGDLQSASRSATLAYMPWMLGLGLQYALVHGPTQQVAVVASATYRVWSDYVNRQNERPLPDYAWSDTIGLALGLRHVYADRLSSFVDLGFEPSPVPAQTGRTNYVDNDRYVVAAGVSYTLPLASTGLALRFGVRGQLHVLTERSQTKLDPTAAAADQRVIDEWADGAVDNRDEVIRESFGLQTNNPGWPGFSSQGLILGAGLNVSLQY